MEEREELLATVASLYYTLDQSQSDIASRLGVSTSKISRMLKEARDSGIVEIRIRTPIPRDILLEQELIHRFGLRDALVLQTSSESTDVSGDETLLRATGQMAASYLKRILPTLPARSAVGVAWGASIQVTVNALTSMTDMEMDVVQLVGGVGVHTVDGPDMTRLLAAKLGGRPYDMHAPAFVARAETRGVLTSEATVRDALERARNVKLALAGIGGIEGQASAMVRPGLLSNADVAALQDAGAVGEIMGRFYRADGSPTAPEIDGRVIGLDLHELRRIPTSLAVARGTAKVAAICGALRGRHINVLATDDTTARAVLMHAGAERG